jgi:eukaryotic-like serine/threonine-protein kinase
MGKLYSLGKYQLIKRIAVGGMSEIFLASQGGLEGFERAVIVKCIREDLDTENEVKDMFLDEARIAACLKHPNIVHLYDVGRDQETAYLAMEYIFGRDLMAISERTRMLNREIPTQIIIKIMCDVLAGLHYAHEVAEFEDKPLRVIHRDVSPQNVLVSFDGITKLVDFGIAKASARLSKTRVGVLKGKYAYMSPEQVRGKPLDHRSDQFSVAVVAYEVLTGTRLFQRETDYSTMEAVDHCEIPPIRVLRKDVPRRLMRVLRKAMRRNPRRRFSSTKEMERALHKLLRGSTVEQNDLVSGFMRKLFANELQARERAIEQAEDQERELILSTGFEMISEKATRVGEAPDPPLAMRKYEQIIQDRQVAATEIQAKLLGETPPGPTDDDSDDLHDDEFDDEPESDFSSETITRPETRRPRAKHAKSSPRSRTLIREEPAEGVREDFTEESTAPEMKRKNSNRHTAVHQGPIAKALNDWRILVLIFFGVMVLALFILLSFGGSQGSSAPAVDPGQGEDMKTVARPGLDGFLSVSVGAHIRVKVNDKDMGMGAFGMHPLPAGLHKVELINPKTGRTYSQKVHIIPDREQIVGPMDFQ